jgi:molecular chaperone GrpE
MIDPKGPKPSAGTRPDAAEPHFESGGDEQPMYATEPEAPGSEGGAPSSANGPFGGGWDVPGQAAADKSIGGPQADRGRARTERPAPPGSAFASGQPGAQTGPDAARFSSGDAATPDALAQLKAALAAAEANAKESHEQYLRALAEMENVRRRAQDDVSKAHKYAIESFAENMLPVRDSLEMALTVEVPSVENLKEGVEATLRQLTQAFDRNRVLVLDPLHQKFDPNLHQAISMVPSKDVAPNHVVSVLQKGYMINDRILRPALVTVSRAA